MVRAGDYGVLGTGSTLDLLEPPASSIDLGDEFTPETIDCGYLFCCAVSNNKTLKCWGLCLCLCFLVMILSD